jgi:hypothetical protein
VDLAKGGRGLTAHQLVQVRGLINELMGSISVDANLVAGLNLLQAESLDREQSGGVHAARPPIRALNAQVG